MPLVANQGDYVYYTDTSSGNPTGWSWYFVGGTPTGSVDQNPVIRYLSPSGLAGSFPATLTITRDDLVATKTENSAITVVPESLYIEVYALPDPFSVDMSTSLTYGVSGSTGSVSYYTWDLVGITGFTGPGSTLTQSFTIDDWYQVSGYYDGAAYSTYVALSTVFANSFLGNVTGNNVQITYNKNGPDENINFGDPMTYDPLNSYYTSTVLPGYTTSYVGLPGSGLVFSIYATGGYLDNTYFRAHSENMYYSTCSMDVSITRPVDNGVIPLKLIASGSSFMLMDLPYTGWESLNRYVLGDYMLPGDVSTYFDQTIYVGDYTSVLSSLTLPDRYWTTDQIDSLVFESAIATQTSKNLEMFPGFLPLATIFGEDGNYGLDGGVGGCCLPCFNIAGDVVELQLDIQYSPSGSLQGIDPGYTYTLNIIISDNTINGGQGNSTDARLVLAQDTGAGSGIATLMQAALDDYFINILGNPSNDFVTVDASPDYAYQFSKGSYSVDTFNGLKISILKNSPINPVGGPYLVKIDLKDTFGSKFAMNAPYNKTSAFGVRNPFYPGNWTCMGFDYLCNPAQDYNQSLPVPYRGFSYGNINY